MSKTGIPITEVLETLSEETKSAEFKKIIEKLLDDIKGGQSLSTSMKKHPHAFDSFYISLIEVGEEAGTLDKNLQFLSKQMEKDFALRKKIQGAALYPAIVLSATFVIGVFISFFILPKLAELFTQFDTELPLPSRILLFFADLVKEQGIFLLIGGALLVVGIIFISRLKASKPYIHYILLHAPVFGKIVRYEQLSRVSRNLGTLIQSGVPITEAIEVTSSTVSNVYFQVSLAKSAQTLQQGSSLHDSLKEFKNLYPPIVLKMINVGEKSGSLEEVLLYLGDYYDEEVDSISKNLTTILEPILLIIIGLAVGFVALAIIGPIYELTGSIH